MSDYWLENAAAMASDDGEPVHTIVDLGYVRSADARSRADQLLTCLGRRNLQIVAYNRLLVHIPPTRVAAILRQFPAIEAGPGYCWTTHHWLTADSKKYAEATP